MRAMTIHFVYLHPEVRDERWTQLHPFLHPGALQHDNRSLIICTGLDIGHHAFASMQARDWVASKNVNLSIRYDLIQSLHQIREIAGTIGFVNLAQVRKAIEDEPSN